MKKLTAIKAFIKSLEESDIGIVIGDGFNLKEPSYNRDGIFFLSSGYNNLLSVCLGISLCTDKRVFIFCDDSYLLRNLSELAHIAASKRSNIIVVVFASGFYSSVGKHPTIFDSLSAPSGIFFNMGFLVHNYTKYFNTSVSPVKQIREILHTIKGPLVVILKVDYTKSILQEEQECLVDTVCRLGTFINNDLTAYNFVVPINISDTFNLGV